MNNTADLLVAYECGVVAFISWTWPTMRNSSSNLANISTATTDALAEAAGLLWSLPASRRAGVLVRALACFPEISLEASFASGPLRTAISSAWETIAGTAMPIEFLRRRLELRDDATMVFAICGVALANTNREVEERITVLLGRLVEMHAHEASVASPTTD